MPNGVDTTRFTPYGSTKYREKINGDFIVLYVGRLVYRKGVHFFVKDEIPNAKLVIAGKGPLLYYIMEKAEADKLKDKIILIGKVSDRELPDLYRSADVFVLPSIYGESFGIVALEAMASGLPIIASPVGGIKEIVKDGENGLLLEEKTPIAIAKYIIRLYRNDDLRCKLARRAREIAVGEFD